MNTITILILVLFVVLTRIVKIAKNKGNTDIVTEVIVGVDETQTIDGLEPELWYENFRGQVCKRTSYNTTGNTHKSGGTPYRGNFAGIGYTYREDLDAFIPPKPLPSFILDSNFIWQAPIALPTDGKMYSWNEESETWVEVNG